MKLRGRTKEDTLYGLDPVIKGPEIWRVQNNGRRQEVYINNFTDQMYSLEHQAYSKHGKKILVDSYEMTPRTLDAKQRYEWLNTQKAVGQ